MKNKIIMWAMLVLLSFLTACGGSDSDGSRFASGDPGETDGDGDGDGDAPAIVDDATAIALGTVSGTTFTPQLAQTGLAANESLSSNGSTTVTVDIVDEDKNNEVYSGVVEVSFTSTCVAQGLAEFNPAVVPASGSAQSTYKDLGCGKEFGVTDDILVYVDSDNANAAARTQIPVEASDVGAIQFVSAAPNVIALSGYGTQDVPSLSQITFQVVDSSSNPMPDRTVRFELDVVGNVTEGGAELSLDQAITDAEGTVTVILNAGAAASTIRVKALVDIRNDAGNVIDTISTLSVPITMATSLGDQNSFSLAVNVQNPNAWAFDGTEVELTVSVGDHNQNPVIDGTTVYFRATGGLIQPSCETTGGTCTVTWQSSNPRPVDGYVTIMASTRGQSDFQDANANGLFDTTEAFTTYGESFLDANGNGAFETTGDYQPNIDIDNDGTDDFGWNPDHYRVFVDASGTPVTGGEDVNFLEEFLDSNKNGSLDLTPANFYQGVNCSAAAFTAGHCAEQIDVVGSARIQMSQGNSAYIEGPFAWDSVNSRYDTDTTLTCISASFADGAQNIAWRVADSAARRNHLPSGSTINVEAEDVEVLTSTGDGAVESIGPVSTAPLRTGSVLTAAQKYDYLNGRGHLITANVLREDDTLPTSGLGSVAISIDSVNGGTITGGLVTVDTVGYQSSLFENGFPVSDIDVSGGTRTYTLKVRNLCGLGLPADAVLQVSLANGTLDSATPSGGSNVVESITASSVEVSIADPSQTTIVDLEISSDGGSDTVPQGLIVTYYVPVGSDFSSYTIGSGYQIAD